jgi:UDP-2,3-diacylglucosamine pyrophosphatase LpxH
MILVVSDLHLGYEACNRDAFSKFLDYYESQEIDHLVLLGDFFDFWRRNNSEIISENKDIIEKLFKLSAKKIHYIVGNHDYYMLSLAERYGDNFPFTISKNLRLNDGGNKFYFTHGYEFEAMQMEPVTLEMYEEFSEKMCFSEDVIGGLASQVWSLINGNDLKEKLEKNPRARLESLEKLTNIYKFANSKGKCFYIGMKPDERLIFGHTHGPFINSEKTVANAGSWVNELPTKQYQNSYIEISDGNMELKFFKF